MAMFGSKSINRAQKAQVFSAELVLASGFFIAAFVALYMAWYSMYWSYVEEQSDNDMKTVLFSIADMAVLSPGSPSNWEATAKENASSFGFATAPNRLSDSKLSVLQSLNSTQYYSVKEGMGAGRFDVYINVGNSTGTFYAFGIPASQNASMASAFSVQRMALLNDSIATVYVQVWRTKVRAT
jgi:hypothetical protein